ncbi:helix-turn-helix domain-containing protein [Sphingobacterium faecale]|uniref:Helix-turn-helix transcriptional regulator n=1 Tax=Sphingobacterium faecale TaxID=2803775 RepID=A0ABS1R2T1_9SPHI|nr:AraC family transcriptional regulator [Sphingobacterium faecale]MBL1409021.1 helix-turn-helix transcriptional regulator [Sphingobacterium faecale]
MALLITLENVHKLYDIDRSRKMEGLVILRQSNDSDQKYTSHSRLFDGLLLAIMVKGTMRARIHFLEYTISVGDIAVLQPQLMIETEELSEDAEIITIGLSLDFLTNFPVLRDFVMNDQMRWQPIVKLDPDEINLQIGLVDLLQAFYDKKQSHQKTAMLQHLVAVLMCMISEKYTRSGNKDSRVKNRTHELIDEFYSLLSRYAHQERSVTFYAEKLNLTPQYLTTFLKQNTGRSVLQWVDQMTVLHAKTMLKSTNLSIKQISGELHFGDTSLFCRFFKRLTGVSPTSYRNNM